MLITIKEYAKRHGLNPGTVKHKCQRGSFRTAQKVGRDWLIEESEPNVDHRVKTGAYRKENGKECAK